MKINLNQADHARVIYANRLSEKDKEDRAKPRDPDQNTKLDDCNKKVTGLEKKIKEEEEKHRNTVVNNNKMLKKEREARARLEQKIRRLEEPRKDESQKLDCTIAKSSLTVSGQSRNLLATPDPKRRRYDNTPSTAPVPTMRSTTILAPDATSTRTREPHRITSGLGSEAQLSGSEIVSYNQGQPRQPRPALFHGQFQIATATNATRQQIINLANATGVILRDGTTYTVVREVSHRNLPL